MKRFLFILTISLSGVLNAQDYTWKAVSIDASRTGCVTPTIDNVKDAIGEFDGNTFVAPNGRRFAKSTATAKTARHILDAQPAMARVKEIVGYSPEMMEKAYPESTLSNWAVDIIMESVQKLSGKPVQMGILNFGGIRAAIPQGDVTLDDMQSIFPFKNYVVYLDIKGSELRKILEKMAQGHFQALGGVRVISENHQLVSAEIGGEPIDDDKVYGVASISFLLNGGDGLFLADAAQSVQHFDVTIIDAIMEFVQAEKVAGRPLTKKLDGRVIVR